MFFNAQTFFGHFVEPASAVNPIMEAMNCKSVRNVLQLEVHVFPLLFTRGWWEVRLKKYSDL
jgi:hypothetical protein